jgi:hypothetical protein
MDDKLPLGDLHVDSVDDAGTVEISWSDGQRRTLHVPVEKVPLFRRLIELERAYEPCPANLPDSPATFTC